MMGVSVKSCAPPREVLLRQPTSALLRELCSEEIDMRRPSNFEALSLLRQLPSYRCDDCCWMNDAVYSTQTGSLG